MAGITPLLDTLLHDVLGKRMDPLNPRQVPETVRPVSPQDALTVLRSDSRLQSGQGPAAVAAGQQHLRTGHTPSQHASLLSSHLTGQSDQNPGSVRFSFSPVGRIIAELLQRFPDSAAVTRAAAPLAEPGASVQEVAGRLKLSIAESGLFYESHLSRWSRGDYPLAGLQREPQMRVALQAGQAGQPGAVPSAESGVEGQQRTDTSPRPNLMNNELLQGLVRQQLDVLATPVLRWEGDVWSGLFMALVLHVPPVQQQGREQGEDSDRDEPESEADDWHSRLDLQVSGLGNLGIDIRLRQGSLGLTLSAVPAVISRLERGGDVLLARLEASGLPATTLRFEKTEESGESGESGEPGGSGDE